MAVKKKQSKVNRVANVLKPTSPFKGMLLFAVVFAVIGGSYYAYKSFAAESAYNFDVIVPYLYTNNGAKVVHDSQNYGAKSGGTNVVSLAPPANYNGGGPPAATIKDATAELFKSSGIDYQMRYVIPTYTSTRPCAILRVPNGTAKMQLTGYGEDAYPAPNNLISVSGNTYHRVCGAWTNISHKYAVPLSVGNVTAPEVNVYSPGTWVLVYSVGIEAD